MTVGLRVNRQTTSIHVKDCNKSWSQSLLLELRQGLQTENGIISVEMEEMEKLEKAKESSIAGENDHLPELASHSLPIQDPMLQSQQFGSICQTL